MVLSAAETSSVRPLQVLYLDFDGVLHPDAAYRTRNGIELLHHPGHSLFEHVSLLDQVLAPYPDVKIVLSTSWLLIKGGYDHAKTRLSPRLQERCIGGTFHRREMRRGWFESISRPDQVVLDIQRRKPARWVAVDDSPDEWPDWTSAHVVRADPTHGIAEGRVLAEMRAKLNCQFGFL